MMLNNFPCAYFVYICYFVVSSSFLSILNLDCLSFLAIWRSSSHILDTNPLFDLCAVEWFFPVSSKAVFSAESFNLVKLKLPVLLSWLVYYMIYLKLVSECGVERGAQVNFFIWYSIDLASFIENTVSQLISLVPWLKFNGLYISRSISELLFPLIYFSILMSVPHYLDYYSFVIVLSPPTF